jgi:hypothetical protein
LTRQVDAFGKALPVLSRLSQSKLVNSTRALTTGDAEACQHEKASNNLCQGFAKFILGNWEFGAG